jgi:hypothetical protein
MSSTAMCPLDLLSLLSKVAITLPEEGTRTMPLLGVPSSQSITSAVKSMVTNSPFCVALTIARASGSMLGALAADSAASFQEPVTR